jgi:hypothetical protein
MLQHCQEQHFLQIQLAQAWPQTLQGNGPLGFVSSPSHLTDMAAVAHAALAQASEPSFEYTPEDQQEPEGTHVCGQDTAELFHFFKQTQAQAGSVSNEVRGALVARAQDLQSAAGLSHQDCILMFDQALFSRNPSGPGECGLDRPLRSGYDREALGSDILFLVYHIQGCALNAPPRQGLIPNPGRWTE